MMQLDLIARQPAELAANCWHLPYWLNFTEQADLVNRLRLWCAGGFWTPQMLDGKPMNHPLCGLGWDWRPYEYFATDRPLPPELYRLAKRAVAQTLPDFLDDYSPDVAIINYFPVGSSLGMHQDKSEDEALKQQGSPIVTLSLGDSCIFRLGNSHNNGQPYQDVECKSGDLLVMGGRSRMAFHAVTKIYPNTTPAGLEIKPGRLSVTIRQAKVAQSKPLPATHAALDWWKSRVAHYDQLISRYQSTRPIEAKRLEQLKQAAIAEIQRITSTLNS